MAKQEKVTATKRYTLLHVQNNKLKRILMKKIVLNLRTKLRTMPVSARENTKKG